jgi:membrane-associated phospholipid phosphatase
MDRKPAVVVVTGLAFTLIAAVLFIWLAGEVWRGDVDTIDLAVLGWFVEHRTPGWTDFFFTVTSLGSRALLGVVGSGLVVALALLRRWGAALALTTSVLGGILLSQSLKLIFRRPRPPLAERLTENVGYAFPSGHTIAGFAFFVTLALLAASHAPGRALRLFLPTYALVVGTLVAISRLYLGAHFLSDVVGGALVGTGWSVTVVLAEHRWRHRRGSPRRSATVENPA